MYGTHNVKFIHLPLDPVAVSYLEIKYGNSDSRNAVYLIVLPKISPFSVRSQHVIFLDFRIPALPVMLSLSWGESKLSKFESDACSRHRLSFFLYSFLLLLQFCLPMVFFCCYCLTSCSCHYSKVFKGVTYIRTRVETDPCVFRGFISYHFTALTLSS